MFDIGSFSLGTFLGFFIKSIVNHFLAKSRGEQERIKNRFNNAADRFRESLSAEKQAIESDIVGNNTYAIVRDAFDKHHTAMINFSPFLSGKDRRRFEETWEQYYYQQELNYNKPIQDYLQNYLSGDKDKDIEEIENNRDKTLKLINELFDFAKPK